MGELADLGDGWIGSDVLDRADEVPVDSPAAGDLKLGESVVQSKHSRYGGKADEQSDGVGGGGVVAATHPRLWLEVLPSAGAARSEIAKQCPPAPIPWSRGRDRSRRAACAGMGERTS